MIHELKILPEFFEAVESGVKTAEIRRDDRKYAAGDELTFREFVPEGPGGGYTGRTCWPFLVTHVCRYGQPDGQVVLSIAKTPARPEPEDGLRALGKLAELGKSIASIESRRRPEYRVPTLVMSVDLPRFGVSKGDTFEYHSENEDSFFVFVEEEDGPSVAGIPKRATFVTWSVVRPRKEITA